MKLLIMGAPGAGKGTQATAIAEHYRIPAISTGAMFRDNVARETELGKQVKAIMDAGEFVPDEVTEAIVADRLSRDDAANGYLLDGFPRTMHQVEFLDALLAEKAEKLDAVLSLTADDEELVSRLLQRAQIEGRSDDNEDTIRRRMEVYRAETEPLLQAYRDRGLLVEVDGIGTIDEVRARITKALDEFTA